MASTRRRKVQLVLSLELKKPMDDDRPDQRVDDGPPPMYRLCLFPSGGPGRRQLDGTAETQRALIRLLNAAVYLEGSSTLLPRICKTIAVSLCFL